MYLPAYEKKTTGNYSIFINTLRTKHWSMESTTPFFSDFKDAKKNLKIKFLAKILR